MALDPDIIAARKLPAPLERKMNITQKLPLSRTEFYMAVLAICIFFQASMTSGYRTKARNQIVGGADNSKHLNGYAFDIVPDHPSDSEGIALHARSMGFDVVNEGDHVHIEFDPKS